MFDLGLSLGPLKEARDRLMNAGAKSPKTWQTYDEVWKMFSTWCDSAGRNALPAAGETVELFVAWAVDVRKYRMATIQLILAAVRERHGRHDLPNPITEQVKRLFLNARKEVKERPKRKAITPELLALALEPLDARSDAIAVRDRALLFTLFFSGWRRSEIAGLEYPRDLTFDGKGVILELGASKADQTGEIGRTAKIPYRGEDPCPVKTLEAYLKVRGQQAGPLWLEGVPKKRSLNEGTALEPRTIYQIVKSTLVEAGIDPEPYCAHSFRSGMVTASLEAGADALAIMQRTGHRDLRTLQRYVQKTRAWRHDPMANVKFPPRRSSAA